MRATTCIRKPILLWLLLCGASLASACSQGRGNNINGNFMIPMDSGVVRDSSLQFPDTGIGVNSLSIVAVSPNHGSFLGGNTVILRGTGLTAADTVTFGTFEATMPMVIDTRRMSVVVPTNAPGVVDVTVTSPSGGAAHIANGYTYERISVDPSSGPSAGGTLITVQGAPGSTFADGDTITLGDTPCADVVVVSPTRMTCRAAPFAPGTVDVIVTHVADNTTITASQGYTYYNSSDPYGGGLGGGPIAGTLTVTVLDSMFAQPIPGACVVVNDPHSSTHGGETDSGGQISISGDDLVGPLTITAAKMCFEKTTFVAANANQITVFLQPWLDPSCGAAGGMPPSGVGQLGSFAEGQLVWDGPNEFGPNPWLNVPEPRNGEVKVAYVYATQLYSVDAQNPAPDQPGSGTHQRVTEADIGSVGYTYRIFVQAGGMAIYAVAGLEDQTTHAFTPYVLGVARNVLVGPGGTASDVRVKMTNTLDQIITANVTPSVTAGPDGPDHFRARTAIDLGGEGFIYPVINGVEFNLVTTSSRTEPIRFVGQGGLSGVLADARYWFDSLWGTGAFLNYPVSKVWRTGVADISSPILLNDFIGVPVAVAPLENAVLPSDRMLRWTADGSAADLQVISMTGGDGNPAWHIYLPGDVDAAPVPDFSAGSMTCSSPDISAGTISWSVTRARIPGFDFQNFSYQQMNRNYWNAYSVDRFDTQL